MSVMPLEPVVPEQPPASLRTALVAAGARWATGQRQLVRLVVELEASGEWMLDRSSSCAAWVASALDVEVSTVREWLRIGRLLRHLPVIDGAFDQGRLSYSKVRAVTRLATPENEVELCEMAETVPAGRLPRALAAWLQRHETPGETEARQQESRGLWWRTDVDGMRAGCFRLPPEAGAVVEAAVEAQVRRNGSRDASADAPGERWPTIPQQRADALIALLRGGGAGVGTEVIVHVRGDGCSLDDGSPIADSVVERIAPQAFLRALIHDAESRPINASGRHRHPTDRQRRVVHERDQVCVDCGATEFLEYDHDPDYEQSHQTVIEELKLRCRTCHRNRHRTERALD